MAFGCNFPCSPGSRAFGRQWTRQPKGRRCRMKTSPIRANQGVPPGTLPIAFRAKQKCRTAYGQNREGRPACRRRHLAPS
eukprot:12917933-Prorocentrum_lima.AAC.1